MKHSAEACGNSARMQNQTAVTQKITFTVTTMITKKQQNTSTFITSSESY